MGKEKKKEKTPVKILMLGDVNSGKATTIGHLIGKCGGLNDEAREKLEEYSPETGKNYTSLLEMIKKDFERGDAVESSLYTFETLNHHITITDTPGHRDFMKNFIIGSSQADAAIFVISAVSGEFESGFSQNGQSRAHIKLASILGIKQLICAVSKMDATQPLYSETRFSLVVAEVSENLKQIGCDPTVISFIPISGLQGDNLTEPSENMPWYKKPTIDRTKRNFPHRTLLEALDQMTPPSRPMDRPLRLPVQDVYKVAGLGTVPSGRVETGILRVGMVITFAPTGLRNTVKSLELLTPALEVDPGGIANFTLGTPVPVTDVLRGFVVGDPSNDPPKEAISFQALIAILNHTGEIRNGHTAVLDCHTARGGCRIVEIIEKCDRRSGKTNLTAPKSVKSGDIALFHVIPTEPICVESFAEYPALGRFLLRDLEDARRVVAAGVITLIQKKNEVPGRRI